MGRAGRSTFTDLFIGLSGLRGLQARKQLPAAYRSCPLQLALRLYHRPASTSSLQSGGLGLRFVSLGSPGSRGMWRAHFPSSPVAGGLSCSLVTPQEKGRVSLTLTYQSTPVPGDGPALHFQCAGAGTQDLRFLMACGCRVNKGEEGRAVGGQRQADRVSQSAHTEEPCWGKEKKKATFSAPSP